jgi:hypothetical protein
LIEQEGKFVISVKNNKRLDYEQIKQMNFKVRWFGEGGLSITTLSITIKKEALSIT